MLSPLALLVALSQAQVAAQPKELPVIPAGADRAFQATVQKTVDAIKTKDWAGAALLADRLPKPTVRVQIDWAGVPASRQGPFKKAIEDALALWKLARPEAKYELAERGEIKIGFADILPVDEATRLPKGLVSFVSDDPKDPRVEGVVALHRLNDKTTTDEVQVQNETMFLVGLYFGLGQIAPSQSAMGRTDNISNAFHPASTPEKLAARDNLAIAAFLRQAIEKRTEVTAGRAQTRVSPVTVDFGEVTQGQFAFGVFEVTNLGNGPSALRVTPDCSCFHVVAKDLLAPNENVRVTFQSDTTMFPGPFHKQLFVTTSDPDRPFVTVDVRGYVRPAYRFLRNKGRGLVFLEDDGGKATYYLALDKDVKLNIKRVSVQGISAFATIEPWSGRLPDPEINGPEADRQGYKIEILINPETIRGRMVGTLVVETDDKVWHHLFHSFQVQKGIAADPGQLYLGLIDNAPRRFTVLLTRPGRPFKITGASVDNPHLKVWPEVLTDGDWRVVVEFDGKAISGSLGGTVKIKTDDPGQPVVEVPVAAEVK